MTRETVRRRRGNLSTSSTTSSAVATGVQQRNRSGVTASAASTTRETPTTSDVQPTSSTQSSPSTPKTIEQVIEEEDKSFSQFLSLCAIVTFIFFYMIRTTELPPGRRVYAVIVDAGSTGTRGQIFEFVHNITTNELELRNTKMHTIKKSIAALGTGVGGTGNQFFKPLLENVKKGVPGIRRRKRTPIVLGATAGLRLLGSTAAEKALSHARTAFNTTGFLFREDYVSILEENDEAIYAWITVNYLLGNVGHGALSSGHSTVAVLELGGASTQIVYPFSTVEDGTTDDDETDKMTIDIIGQKYDVHATSHLGLGLFSFTQKLYRMFETEGVLEEGNPCFRNGKTFTDKMLRLGVEGSEETRRVTIVGDGDFDRCVASAELVIGDYSKNLSPLPKDSIAYAFAFFYDKTVGLGLSREPTKNELRQKGRDLCNNSHGDTRGGANGKDEACAEFSYVYALIKAITNDFDKELAVRVIFEQYIDGHMLGWPLGAALKAIQNPVMQAQISLDNEPLMLS